MRTGTLAGHINIRLFITVSALFAAALALGSCYYDKEEILYPGSTNTDCNTVPAKFAADVQPLIISKCAIQGCHDATGASGGVVMQDYTQISSKKDRINTRAVVDKTMPPTGPLTPAESAKLKCWIDAGAPNN